MFCNKITWLKCLCITVLLFLIYYNLDYRTIVVRTVEEIGQINPPKPTAEQLSTLAHLDWDDLASSDSNSSSAKFDALELISSIVQQQLSSLQTVEPTDCDSVVTIQCGHIQDCGFACQVHHRIACLMTSYALNLPLIHDEYHGWSYESRWSDVFRSLGSGCKPGPNTFTVEWQGVGTLPLIYRRRCYLFCATETFYHPLDGGLPAPRELAEFVELVHTKPWLWWIGQFMKYGLTLREDQRLQVRDDKRLIGLKTETSPIVGIQVRRTDKVIESEDSIHPLEQYFEESTIFYQKQTGQTEVQHKAVFVASDDHLVLEEAVERFQPPEWKVFRFRANATHRKMSQRTQDLYSIARDLTVLSECDFVVCGFSSNICRLLLEMLSFRFIDPWARIRSLDGEYSYLYKSKVLPQKVLKY